jgi:hypothetical protein
MLRHSRRTNVISLGLGLWPKDLDLFLSCCVSVCCFFFNGTTALKIDTKAPKKKKKSSTLDERRSRDMSYSHQKCSFTSQSAASIFKKQKKKAN